MKQKFTALVTGASGGIGLELAKLFAADGVNLVLVARSKDKLAKIASELSSRHSVQVSVIAEDLSVPGAAAKVRDEAKRLGITVDYLVNNAGVGLFGRFAETELKDDLGMMQLNISSLVELTKYFLPEMLSRGNGRILNVASTAAFQPGPLMAIYYASKAFVLSYSEALAEELAGTGVTVTTLCPGPTETGFQKEAGMEGSKLFSRFSVAGAEPVARAGYLAMKRGNTVSIPGFANWFGTFFVRFAPRRLVPKIVMRMQEKAHS